MKKDYPDQILQKYKREVKQMAAYTGDRKRYQQLVLSRLTNHKNPVNDTLYRLPYDSKSFLAVYLILSLFYRRFLSSVFYSNFIHTIQFDQCAQISIKASSEPKFLFRIKPTIKDGHDLQWMAAHQTLTNLLVDLGRAEEAVEEHRKWCDEEPDMAWAHVSHSYALDRAGRLDEAWQELEIALRLDPEDMNVLTAAGDLCAKLGRYEDAIVYWDRVSKSSTSISHLFSKAEMLA